MLKSNEKLVYVLGSICVAVLLILPTALATPEDKQSTNTAVDEFSAGPSRWPHGPMRDYSILAALMPSKDAGNVDFGPYVADLQRRVKRRWSPPNVEQTLKTLIEFEVNKNGNVAGIKVTEPSGLERLDNSAIEAIRKASPLRNLPAGSPNPVRAQMRFSYWFAPGNRTIEPFRQLHKGTPASEVLAKLGPPDKDIGSGIHIYMYRLADLSEVWVGCTDSVVYVQHHLDKKRVQKLIE